MKKEIIFSECHLGIGYEYGNLFLDNCGQCLNDIEKSCLGWRSNTAAPDGAIIENISCDLASSFNPILFSFTCRKASRTGIDVIAKEASKIWKLVKANFGLTEFTRIGARYVYHLPMSSIDAADKLSLKTTMSINIPNNITSSHYEVKSNRTNVLFKNGDMEYRVDHGSFIRIEGINPNRILKGDPRHMSARQREFFFAQQKQLAEYHANPMYTLSLDVDCSMLSPPDINIEQFVTNQHSVVEKYFLPILKELSL
jgi:hypothetical protein